MTFVGAPEIKLAVTWVSTSGDGDLMCRWIAGGIAQAATFPEACLTLVRPADPKERERLDEGRLRILRRIADVHDYLREKPIETRPAFQLKLVQATLSKILSDEGWK